MAYMVLDLREEVSTVFKCKSDAAEKVGIGARTLTRWREKGGVIKHGRFMVDCNCDIVKCVVRNRDGDPRLKNGF